MLVYSLLAVDDVNTSWNGAVLAAVCRRAYGLHAVVMWNYEGEGSLVTTALPATLANNALWHHHTYLSVWETN